MEVMTIAISPALTIVPEQGNAGCPELTGLFTPIKTRKGATQHGD